MFEEAPDGGGRRGGLFPFRFILLLNIWRRLFNAAKLIARNEEEVEGVCAQGSKRCHCHYCLETHTFLTVVGGILDSLVPAWSCRCSYVGDSARRVRSKPRVFSETSRTISMFYHGISGGHMLHQSIVMSGELLLDFFRFFIFGCIGKFNNKWRRTTLDERNTCQLACTPCHQRLTSIVWDWCMDLIAFRAHWRFWKVTKAQPEERQLNDSLSHPIETRTSTFAIGIA